MLVGVVRWFMAVAYPCVGGVLGLTWSGWLVRFWTSFDARRCSVTSPLLSGLEAGRYIVGAFPLRVRTSPSASVEPELGSMLSALLAMCVLVVRSRSVRVCRGCAVWCAGFGTVL